MRPPLPDHAPRLRTLLIAVGHALLFALAFFCSFGLYYNFRRFNEWVEPAFLPLLPLVVTIKLIVFASMKMFKGSWRYVGMRDVLAIIKATHIGTFAFVAAYFGIEWAYAWATKSGERYFAVFPQSVFLLDWGVTIAMVSGARILVRLYYEEIRPVVSSGHRRCLILGAGDTGEALLREILRMSVERYRVVGFLDDNPNKIGSLIHGVPVLGRLEDTHDLCEKHQIDELLFAMPRAPQRVFRRIVEQCKGLNVRFRTIPAMEQVIEGQVTVSQIRDVDIKDLLGREQVELDEAKISAALEGQRVVVTGAGGSIGSEICRQVLRYRPERLILIEQAENNLFEVDREFQTIAPEIDRICYVADICDASRIEQILTIEQPDVVFHAAAHKHVPMMEINVGESIKNNILGTKTIADAAKRHRVHRFVMISTDKAVNPTSVMGCTKRIAEMYIQQLRQGGSTQFMTVRFGNVLGSSGSVVPIFARQIVAGGPVTVTDPAMTRYFMTIPEASQLVLQAGVIGQDGDIFVLDMGGPVKIVDLAHEMITLSGLRPGEDIEIVFTGVRPGEKLYEELSIKGEDMGPTDHEKIYVWRNRKEDWDKVYRQIDGILAVADTLPPKELKAKLSEIVPNYQPDLGARSPRRPQAAASSPNATRVATDDLERMPLDNAAIQPKP